VSRHTLFHPTLSLTRGIAPLWGWLRGPWPALLLTLLSLGMLLALWLLPQLPGQLADEPAAAARWLRATAADVGRRSLAQSDQWGNLGLLLGLYDVLHSPTTGVLLAAWGMLAAIQFLDALARLRFYHRLAAPLPLRAPLQAEPRPLPLGSPILRRRVTLHAAAPTVTAALAAWLTSYLGTAPTPSPPLPYFLSPLPYFLLQNATDEQHWTIVRRPRMPLLRALLPLGIGLAVIALWLTVAFGWQVNAPPLAGGEMFQSPRHDLTLRHAVTLSPTVFSELEVRYGNATLRLPGAQPTRRSINGATVAVAPTYAGIWVSSVQDALQLALPGRSSRQPQLGLVFPDPGSEESILLPEQGIGLRIVRGSNADSAFVLELYRSQEVQPVYRAELTDAGRAIIPLGDGQPDLIVTTLRGLHVTVRHFPWVWLTWVGLVVAAVGSLSLVLRPAWLTLQVAPWGEDRTVIVLQSDRADLLADLRRQLDLLNQPPAAPPALPPQTGEGRGGVPHAPTATPSSPSSPI